MASMTTTPETPAERRRVLTDFMTPLVQEHGHRFALRWRQGYRHQGVTYRELGRAAHQAARRWHEAGLRAGDPVLLFGPGGPEWVTAFLGTVLAGGVVVPLDEISRPEFVVEVGRRTRARLQVVQTGFPAAPDVPCLPLETFHPSQQSGPEDFTPPCRGPDDLLEIVFTSGTTSQPKGVMLTHHNVVANIASLRQAMGWPAGHRFLSVLPLSHMLGQVLGLFVPLRFGGTLFFAGTRRPSVLRDCFRRERITVLVTVPAFLDLLRQQVLNAADRDGRLTHLQRGLDRARSLPVLLRRRVLATVRHELFPDLRFVFVGGAALNPATEAFFDALGICVLQGYGMTEASPVIACNTPHAHRSGTVGRAIPGVEVRSSSEGEIMVRGPNVTPGYWENPEATGQLLENGWLHTGDLGAADADGFWKILGRKKDIIIGPSGMNIYPEDVEAVLNQLPGVRDSCVAGVEETDRLRLVGCVILQKEAPWEPQAMLTLANARLASHQRLQAVEQWPDPDFPRSRTLKVKRNEVLARLRGHTPDTVASPAEGGGCHDDELVAVVRKCLELPQGQPIGETQRLTADLGLGSLGRLDLLSSIEELFGADLPESAIDEQTTVAELRRHIQTRSAAAAAPRFPLWARRPVWRAVRNLLSVTWRPLFQFYCPLEVRGLEHLDRLSGPAIFIPNHTSNLDTPALLSALPGQMRRRVAVAAAADYWFRPDLGFFGWIPGVLSALYCHAFPFSRTDAVEPSLRYLGELVDEGWSILIYPEGTRSRTGAMGAFKGGIGLIARAIQVPVVPVAMTGCFESLPAGRRVPRPARIAVIFGEPCLPPFEDTPAALASRFEQQVRDLAARLRE
jgi:long-chain acyl-CoA synthetase